MSVLGKDAILAADDIKFEIIDVPEWGGKVKIKELSGDERDRIEQSMIDNNGRLSLPKMEGYRARLVALSVVDDAGKVVFSQQDVKALGQKSALALDRVVEACQMLSALTPQAVEAKKGNSEGAPSDSGTSA